MLFLLILFFKCFTFYFSCIYVYISINENISMHVSFIYVIYIMSMYIYIFLFHNHANIYPPPHTHTHLYPLHRQPFLLWTFLFYVKLFSCTNWTLRVFCIDFCLCSYFQFPTILSNVCAILSWRIYCKERTFRFWSS